MANESSTNATLPKNFNWKIIPYITQNKTINTVEKAKKYYRTHGHKGGEIYKKYHKVLYKVPEDFEERDYIDFLKTHYNVKVKADDDLAYEKLYQFYDLIGRKKYPLNDEYYRFVYKIPKTFNKDKYKHILDIQKNSEYKNYNTIYEYYAKKGKFITLEFEYYKILYELPNKFNDRIYVRRYNELNTETNVHKIIEFFINNKEKYPLDIEYYKIYYDIPENFNYTTFKRRYPDVEFEEINTEEHIKELSKLLKKYPIDEIYIAYDNETNKDINGAPHHRIQCKDDKNPRESMKSQAFNVLPHHNAEQQYKVEQHNNAEQQCKAEQHCKAEQPCNALPQRIPKRNPYSVESPKSTLQEINIEEMQNNHLEKNINENDRLYKKLKYYLYFQKNYDGIIEEINKSNYPTICELFNKNKDKDKNIKNIRTQSREIYKKILQLLDHENITIDNTFINDLYTEKLTLNKIKTILTSKNIKNETINKYLDIFKRNESYNKYFSSSMEAQTFFFIDLFSKSIDLNNIKNYHISKEHNIIQYARNNMEEYMAYIKNIK